ncbi:MAG TPA: glycosyltransferase family 2 protein [Tissierellales bacterium]|nr:glycosyltransferase family 2 protein [Tissierellales bacterium]
MKLVSVVIPTYKRSEMLKNTIDSVLRQTYENIEIIIVDDNDPNSKEREMTQRLMESYKGYKNIKYILHPKNLNGAAARNTGFNNASGYYIALLDDDDEFLPKKIESQVKRLEELDDSWGMCYTQFIRKKNGKIIDKGIENKEGYIGADILKGELYISAGSNLMIRKDIIDEIEGFNENFLRRQDLEFLIRASQITKIAHVPEICLVINKDDRSNALSEYKLIKNTNEFLNIFSGYINDLPKLEKKKVAIGQYLLLARYYAFNKEFKLMYETCKKNDITLKIFIRYIFYLIKRKLLKQCYGFKI